MDREEADRREAGRKSLEQAIPSTVYAASPVIRSDLALLADRMRVRVPLPQALRQFADDLDDPTADLIIAALMMNSRLRGPGLRQRDIFGIRVVQYSLCSCQ